MWLGMFQVDIVDMPKAYNSLVTNETLAKLYESNGALLGVDFPSTTVKKVCFFLVTISFNAYLSCSHVT